MTNRCCPYCKAMPTYTHRDGVPVCKCSDKNCKGNERWLEYEEFEDQAEQTEEIECGCGRKTGFPNFEDRFYCGSQWCQP